MSAQAGVLRTNVANVIVRILKMEAHSLTSTPTQYPVEDGKSIADHVNLNPNVVQIRCEMPNSYNGGNGPERARLVMQQFAKMRERREPIQLLTEHLSYKNMVLVACHPVHQAPYKGALVIDLVFQQIGIIGQTGLISASGGRPANKLSQDGTQATATGYSYAGEVAGINSGNVFKSCGSALGGYSS